jgi:hypothetical protein
MLNYRVSTPLAAGKLIVTVHGVESREGEFPGRQWFVFLPNTGMRVGEGLTFTDEWQPIQSLLPGAAESAYSWLRRVCDGEEVAPFVDTCPPGQRERLGKARHRAVLAGLATGRQLPLPDVRPDDVERWQAYVRGDLVREAPDGFWTVKAFKDGKDVTPEMRRQIIDEVKSLFSTLEPRRYDLRPAMTARLPLWSRDGNHWRFRLDFQLTFQQRAHPETPLLVEMRVPVSADVADPENPGNISWQVEGLELVRARTMPHPGRQGPGQ